MTTETITLKTNAGTREQEVEINGRLSETEILVTVTYPGQNPHEFVYDSAAQKFAGSTPDQKRRNGLRRLQHENEARLTKLRASGTEAFAAEHPSNITGFLTYYAEEMMTCVELVGICETLMTIEENGKDCTDYIVERMTRQLWRHNSTSAMSNLRNMSVASAWAQALEAVRGNIF